MFSEVLMVFYYNNDGFSLSTNESRMIYSLKLEMGNVSQRVN